MAIPEYECFPEELTQNMEILYHGTSNVAEAGIEQNGIRPVQDEKLHALASELMGIHRDVLKEKIGRNPGGFEALVFYDAELNQHETRPISLAYTSDHSQLYASAGFCGGELARTVSRIHPYLHRLINDPEARDERQSPIDKAIASLPPYSHHSYLDRRVLDVEELRHRVALIDQQMMELVNVHEAYRYGVIYAVRMDRLEAFPPLREESNGIYALGPIPLNAVIGKVITKATIHKSDPDGAVDDLLQRIEYWRPRFQA